MLNSLPRLSFSLPSPNRAAAMGTSSIIDDGTKRFDPYLPGNRASHVLYVRYYQLSR